MIRKYRVKYYDAFSLVYDRFIALHSKDLQQQARNFLISTVAPREGDTILDICTEQDLFFPFMPKKLVPAGGSSA